MAGGGALFDLGCHTVDVMRWLMGKSKRVASIIQNYSATYNVDDNSVIAVEFDNGGLGILDAAFAHRAGPNPIEICGNDSYIGRDPHGGLLLNSTQLQAEGIAG